VIAIASSHSRSFGRIGIALVDVLFIALVLFWSHPSLARARSARAIGVAFLASLARWLSGGLKQNLQRRRTLLSQRVSASFNRFADTPSRGPEGQEGLGAHVS
jgi:hypothetical protein